jgi:hypothetical protein
LLYAKTYSRNLEISQRKLVTRKPEKHKFLTILKKKNWLNFARENAEDTRERISSRVLVA